MTRQNHSILTRAEMIELTKCKQKSRQKDALRNAGILFFEGPDGHPSTTWGHVLNPVALRNSTAIYSEEPDFEAMD